MSWVRIPPPAHSIMINLNFNTYAKQGLVGLGKAISHYLSLGEVVSIPITDNQGYDLVLDSKEKLFKIQVKTSNTKSKSGFNVVYLRTVSGRKVIGFDPSKFDILFILTSENKIYQIPNDVLKPYKNMLTLNSKWDQYLINYIQ
jgi:hypothetical protein